jgi:hydrogenase/urease accessory protein HupE
MVFIPLRRGAQLVAWGLVLALLLAFFGPARADLMKIEIIAGTVTTRANGDVVLELQISPQRLNQLVRVRGVEPFTWGDLRRREPALRARMLAGLSLREGGREAAPDIAEIPGLAIHPQGEALPPFVPIDVTWRHAGLINAALADDAVSAHFFSDGLTQVDLLLEQRMPWWQVLSRSMLLGIEHIVPFGLDHILFVLGIYLAASRFRDLLWQVTAFTVAHSLTLGLTMSGILIVGPFWEQFVEFGIAVSIFAVAFENILWRRPPGWPRIFIVGGFGLVHGMSFAGRLALVKWPPGTFALSLFGANVGIEIGQLIVILAAAALTAWWWKRPWYQPRLAVPASLLIGLYGMFAALDRISLVTFPQREFADNFWHFYDHHFWLIPLLIGSATLALIWLTYRLASKVRGFFLPSLRDQPSARSRPIAYRPARDRSNR